MLLRRALPRPDRPAPHARGAACLPGRRIAGRLREGRRSPAGQSALRRALGPALDGRLAVQRLGRLGQAGPRQPAAYLALARLDRRVAQSRQALRPHGRGDARGRRSLAGGPRALRATGYLARNFKLLSREKWMQDTVDHTGQAFLGRDPRLRPLPRSHVRPDPAEGVLPGSRDLRAAPGPDRPGPRHARQRKTAASQPTTHSSMPRPFCLSAATIAIRPAIRFRPVFPTFLGVPFPEPEPVSLPHAAISPDRHTLVIDDQMSASHAQVARTVERSLNSSGNRTIAKS